MKRFIKSLVVVAFVFGFIVPAWGQSTPSTEGRDFWVTFLRAADDNPTELKLTISAKEACDVTIENTNTNYSNKLTVTDNSSTEVVVNKSDAYSSSNETATYTALHVTASKDISLFAGNYRDKSFDATNVLPTSALLDEYLIQTYPPSDHEDKPQGSHFAIVAVDDGETTVDCDLTAKTNKGTIGTTSVTLKQGQVYYIWTGKTKDDPADLSGSKVKARNNKKIAVFQGCPHTNIPNHVRDRDHIVSQAMPIAYWGTEFCITASRKHRRDIVAVMAINDGTKVYINDGRGNKQEVHTFDFATDKKQYWTFEIGEELAYCADKEGESPTHGQLPPPLVIDSSCYLTTSCPAGVHLFMVSNRYDNATEKVSSDTLVSDPAMLWISPIEQVIKEINFATYHTQQVKFHFMNIVTATTNVDDMTWNGANIKQYFHPIRGNDEYSYARIQIQEGNHNLKGAEGFLAHVYGYGERESYAYSCGSSTVQRSVTFNGEAIMVDSIAKSYFCAGKPVEMKLRIGNNEYESVHWDFGDGTTYDPDPDATNKEKIQTTHTYTTPGWYDLTISAVYVNSCTGQRVEGDPMKFSFRIIKPYIKYVPTAVCHEKGETLPPDGPDGSVDLDQCLDTIIVPYNVHGYNTDSIIDLGAVADSIVVDGVTYRRSGEAMQVLKNSDDCELRITTKWEIIASLDFKITNTDVTACDSTDVELPFDYVKGDLGEAWIVDLGTGKKTDVDRSYLSDLEPGTGTFNLPTKDLRPGIYNLELHIKDPQAEKYGWKIKEYTYQIRLTVQYSEYIFKRKYNNVLAVYKAGRGANAGYSFNGYQWYFRDAEDNIAPIFGATSSVYHTEEPLKTGWYSVDLTDQAAVTIRTCEQYIDESKLPDFTPAENEPEGAPQKVLRDQRVLILMENKLYNMYGQQVK